MENTFEQNEQNENVNFQSRINLQPLQESISQVKGEISKVIVGQNKMIDQLLVAILANGHVLLEGVPCGKNNFGKVISKNIKFRL